MTSNKIDGEIFYTGTIEFNLRPRDVVIHKDIQCRLNGGQFWRGVIISWKQSLMPSCGVSWYQMKVYWNMISKMYNTFFCFILHLTLFPQTNLQKYNAQKSLKNHECWEYGVNRTNINQIAFRLITFYIQKETSTVWPKSILISTF